MHNNPLFSPCLHFNPFRPAHYLDPHTLALPVLNIAFPLCKTALLYYVFVYV